MEGGTGSDLKIHFGKKDFSHFKSGATFKGFYLYSAEFIKEYRLHHRRNFAAIQAQSGAIILFFPSISIYPNYTPVFTATYKFISPTDIADFTCLIYPDKVNSLDDDVQHKERTSMKILVSAFASLLAALTFSGVSHGSDLGLELEVRGGHNYSKWNDGQQKFQTNEFRLGANKQLGDLPLSLGLSVGKVNISGIPDAIGRAEGYDLAIEAKAWMPESVTGSENFKPFIRLAHTGYSNFEIRAGGEKMKGSNNGLTAGIGAAYNITEYTAASVEYTYQQKAIKLKDADRQGYKSHGVTVGLAHSI